MVDPPKTGVTTSHDFVEDRPLPGDALGRKRQGHKSVRFPDDYGQTHVDDAETVQLIMARPSRLTDRRQAISRRRPRHLIRPTRGGRPR
jgi:hypothetical protein